MKNSAIEQVVRRMCAEVASRLADRPRPTRTARVVRRELVGCILSSQVPYISAQRWTDAIASAGYLDDEWWSRQRPSGFRAGIRRVLLGRSRYSRALGRYRFANVRSGHIASALDANIDVLFQRPRPRRSAARVRAELVREVAGLGPKTASMLLRNLAISLDVAVLDRHVLRYMRLAGLLETSRLPRSLREYEEIESRLIWYASALGYHAGCLDWSIWATMKAVEELE